MRFGSVSAPTFKESNNVVIDTPVLVDYEFSKAQASYDSRKNPAETGPFLTRSHKSPVVCP
jgi:hypothetical protein